MPAASHFILYVKDQRVAEAFYTRVLAVKPRLDVPGMTEYELPGGGVLGLMPEEGVRNLLGPGIADPARANGIPRSELYLVVADAAACLVRAQEQGARLLSPMQERSWGHVAGYVLDPDGHVLAFALTASVGAP